MSTSEPLPNPANDADYLSRFDEKQLTRLRLNVGKSIRNLTDYRKEIDKEIERRNNEKQPKLFDVEGQ